MTPLHIAVMKARTVVVQALVCIVPINSADRFGWTPFHHAALVAKELREVFVQTKADKTLRTRMGATVEDVEKLTGKKWVDHSKKVSS